jgi:hypothetical protein
MRSDTRVWHADAESLRKWQLECCDHDEGIVEADGATRQQASTQRPDSHDQAAETRTTGGQRSMISLRECERSPRNVARSGVGGLSISVWRALPLLKRQNASLRRWAQQMKSTVSLAIAPLSLSDQLHHTPYPLHRLILISPNSIDANLCSEPYYPAVSDPALSHTSAKPAARNELTTTL